MVAGGGLSRLTVIRWDRPPLLAFWEGLRLPSRSDNGRETRELPLHDFGSRVN